MRKYISGENPYYCSSFDILKESDYKVEIIDEKEFSTKKEMREYEGNLIKSNCCINKNIAGRDIRQYYIDNRERLLKIAKEKEFCNKCNCYYSRSNKYTHYKSQKHNL